MSEIRDEIAKLRTSSPLFATLDDKGIDRLAQIAKPTTFKPNDAIVEVGQTADFFYVIVQGGVRVKTDGREDGKEVARLGAGQFFGEMGILNDEPRTATVAAIGDVKCLAFEKDALLAVLEDYPQILHKLGSVGVERAGKLVDAGED